MAIKNCKRASDYKSGDKVVMVNTSWISYGLAKGAETTVLYINGANLMLESPQGQISVAPSHVEPAAYKKEDLQAKLQQAEQTVEDLKNKLEWLKETGNEEFDEDEYKVWKVLSTLDSKATTKEKAKAITKLIKG